MKRHLALALAATLWGANPLFASDLVPVTLAPISHTDASLTIQGADGTETVYTPADLETLPTYRVTTTTPWREEPADFEGVLLTDLLDAHGLGEVAAILVTAENDYTTTITRALMDDVQVMIATRVDGRAHTRRARGPIQFVIDKGQFDASDLTSESNFVWMAARIEAAD